MPDSIFINNIEDKLPTIQENVINNLINTAIKAGVLISKQDAINSLNEFKDKLKTNNRFFNFIPVEHGSKIRSEVINSYFIDIQSDLKSLYAKLANISAYERQITAASKDDFIKTKSIILEVINKLFLYNFLKNNPEYQDAKYIDFNNAVNKTFVSPKAIVDTKTKTLKLPPSSLNRYSQSRFNLDSSKVEFKVLGGGIFSDNNNAFRIENILDSNPNNFWALSVLCDARPHHKVLLSHTADERYLGSGKQKGNIFESNGIVCEIEYKFSKTIEFNNFKLLPISEHPIYILDISYKTSDTSGSWVTIPGFDPSNYQQTLDWIEWNGPLVGCTSVKITIEQVNFKFNTYQLPEYLLKNNQVWEQLLSSEFNQISNTLELDKILSDSISLNPSDLIRLNKIEEIDNLIKSSNIVDQSNKTYSLVENLSKINSSFLNQTDFSNSKIVSIDKLIYSLGLRFIEINLVNYEAFGYYESQKFESNANILEISLDTEEEHFNKKDGITGELFRETSIEYEVELSDKSTTPILPEDTLFIDSNNNKSCKVVDELLIVNRNNLKATTRFQIPSWASDNPAIQIRKNGQRIPNIIPNTVQSGYQYNYTVTIKTNTNNESYIEITFNDNTFDSRSTYTISYLAHEKSAIVSIKAIKDSEQVLPRESYSSTDKNNKIKLNNYPYIEYEIINNDEVWTFDNPGWFYNPSTLNYNIGKIHINPADTTQVIGTGTFWESNGPKALLTGSIYNSTGISIKILGDLISYPVASITNNSGLYTQTNISTGFLNGSPPTGLNYVIGKTTEIDGIVYGLDNSYYEPIKVYVNDTKSINKTDYEKRIHEAFSSSINQYEYVQIGKDIYFNNSASGRIEISYKYLTQYIKINAILRSHKIYNSKVTPILKNYTIKIKNNSL